MSEEDGVAVGTGVFDSMHLQLCLHGVAPGVSAHSLSLECPSLPLSPDDAQVRPQRLSVGITSLYRQP